MNTKLNRFLHQLRLLVKTIKKNNIFIQMRPLFVACLVFILFGFLGSVFSTVRQRMSTDAKTDKPASGEIPDKIKKLTKSDPVRGNEDAKYVLIEYSDYECPFCKDFHTSLKTLIEDNKDFKWAYRNYPLPFHAGAKDKAKAASCVFSEKGNDAFWEFSDALFEDQALPVNKLFELASKNGVSKSDYDKCMKGIDNDKLAAIYDAATAIGVTGTPSTVIVNTDNNNAVLVVGAVPVEELLTKAKALD